VLPSNTLSQIRFQHGRDMIHATGNVSLAGSSDRWRNLAKGANCKLLIHSNTTDGSTTFTDTIGTHTPEGMGNVQHDTAQHKWGKTSILFDGNGDYIRIPDHADWNMGSGAFTIDCWVRFSSVAGNSYIWSQWVDNDNYAALWYVPSETKVAFQIRTTAGGLVVDVNSGAQTFVVNEWYHIALIRGWAGNVNDWAITVNGNKTGTVTTDTTAWPEMAGYFYIGALDPTQHWHSGWIDEFRVVKGTAMWTKSFFPPISPYV